MQAGLTEESSDVERDKDQHVVIEEVAELCPGSSCERNQQTYWCDGFDPKAQNFLRRTISAAQRQGGITSFLYAFTGILSQLNIAFGGSRTREGTPAARRCSEVCGVRHVEDNMVGGIQRGFSSYKMALRQKSLPRARLSLYLPLLPLLPPTSTNREDLVMHSERERR